MNSHVLSLQGIKKRHHSGFLLDIPSLKFREGGLYNLTGPNGAGKSTLLKILNLIEEPDEGSVFFKDERVTSSNVLDVRRSMGMVMENPYLFHTPVFKNVASGLKFHSMDKGSWKGIVKEALGLVGLDGFESRYAPELSRGESQRVAIARVLAFKPNILFLDEPFSNIDRKHAAVLEELIKTINREAATTIIFTSHDLVQACRMADEVISIVDGKVNNGYLEKYEL